MITQLTLLVMLIFTISSSVSSSFWLFSSISRGGRSRTDAVNSERYEEPQTTFDSLGGLPQIQNAHNALLNSAPIVCARARSSTLVSYMRYNKTSLNWPIFQPLQPLGIGAPHLNILLSGHAGMRKELYTQYK